MTTYYIVRSHWARGLDMTYLRNADGTGCCLGHIGLQCGFPAYLMEYRGLPATVPTHTNARWPAALEHMGAGMHVMGNTAMHHVYQAHTLGAVLMGLNDALLHSTVHYWADNTLQAVDLRTDHDREHAIAQVAARAGMTLVFVDTAADAPAGAQVFGR